MVEWFQGGIELSTSNQNGVRRDSEVLVRPSRRIIGGPDKLQILAEVDQARATGGMVLAGPHVMDLVHLPCVRLVQDSVMQHQYPGVQPNLKPSPPATVRCWMAQAGAAEGYTHYARAQQNQPGWSVEHPSPSHSPVWRQGSR